MNQTRQKQRNRGGSNNHGSLVPTSSCPTDRPYEVRKLLFSIKPHGMPQPKTHTQEETFDVYRRDTADLSFSTRPRQELTPRSFTLRHRDVSPPSVSVRDVRDSRSHEEQAFKSALFSSTSTQQSKSSSIPEIHPLNHPLRPSLTSTVLKPTYTPHPGDLKSRQKEEQGWRHRDECFTGGPSEGDLTSPHKANYWACAIPKHVPPSPDRHSAAWDPNKDYQALLDYTYPLRTCHQMTCEWGSSEPQADMQDSGIELGNLCSSSGLSGLDVSVKGTGQTEERSHLTLDHSFTDLQGFSRLSHGSLSDDALFLADLNSLDCSKEKDEPSNFRSCNDHQRPHHEGPSSISTALTPSTRILYQPECTHTEEDEEFRPLPEQLNELQLLATQVRVITAWLGPPLTGSRESLEPGASSNVSSYPWPEKLKTQEENSQDDTAKEEWSATQTAAHMESVALRSNERWVEPVGGGSRLRTADALLKQLCELTLHQNSQQEQQEQQQEQQEEQSDSLLQHIKDFCSHLEQLIQYLYAVSEKTELLAQPAVDISRLKLSLDEHQREVKHHVALTSCVRHSGQLLLHCINAMSPFLRDTLQLVHRESEALHSYNQYFSSILSAVDTLVQSSPVQQSKGEESLGVQSSSLYQTLRHM